MPVIKSLVGVFVSVPFHGEPHGGPGCRTKEDRDWETRIVQLGDGRSVHEIMRALYHEQLDRGAGLVDVGIWKSFFDRSVMDSIGNLVNEGHIQVKAEGTVIVRNEMATTMRRKRNRPRKGNPAPGRQGSHSQEMLAPNEDSHSGSSTSGEAALSPSSFVGRLFAVVGQVRQRGLSRVKRRRGPVQGPGGR